MKIIAAEGLGRQRAVAAVPVLLAGVTDKDPLVRIARLQALGHIAVAPATDAAPILDALENGLADAEGAVRLAAVRGLAVMAARPGIDRARLATALRARASDVNPAVAAAAREAAVTLNP
jgi:HEAT repeat protein